MLQARPEGYVGKQFGEGFTSYFVAGHYYGILSIEDGLTQDEGKQLLERFKEGLLSADVSNLSSFDATVSNLILSLNFPAHVALAIGTEINGILYVKTIGEGQIFFRRGQQFDLLISGDKSGSGYLKEFDLAVFTTTKMQEVIGASEDIKAFVDMSPPQSIIEKINSEEYGEEEMGFVSLFVEFTKRDAIQAPTILDEVGPKINDPLSAAEPDTVTEEPEPLQPPHQQPQAGMPMVDMADYRNEPSENKLMHIIRSKGFIIVTIIILFALLAWSVIFGVQRRNAEKLDKKVETTKVEIQEKLDKAKDEAFLNLDQSLVLLSDAKTQYEQLKQETGDSRAEQLSAIKTMIDEAESSILKREEKPYDEFYDLALDAKDAKADAIGKEEDTLTILDTAAKKVYVLDLQKKSLEEYVNSDLSDATIVTLYNDEVFFFNPSKGVMKFTSQSKVKSLIPADSEWGKIVDIEIYNGNIYLLDSGKSDIYKYLVTEGGYSDKNSYFGSGTADFENATGMAIDSAVYVSTKTDLHKYLSGAAESFSPTFPNENPQFDGIYTSADDEQVYVLDTSQASVYALTKEGEYQRTLQSSVFAKANGMYVFEGSVHVVSGGKIYSVSLD